MNAFGASTSSSAELYVHLPDDTHRRRDPSVGSLPLDLDLCFSRLGSPFLLCVPLFPVGHPKGENRARNKRRGCTKRCVMGE